MSDVTITLHIELPADALEMSRDGDKTTFVIDWTKVRPLPARSES